VVSPRMGIGLDVHARSVVGCGIVKHTGEITRRRFDLVATHMSPVSRLITAVGYCEIIAIERGRLLTSVP
jgi:hypothetical protein